MAIATLLAKHPEFSKKYEMVNVQPVHLISLEDIPALEEQMRSIQLFIYQPVSDSYRGLPGLSTTSLLENINQSAKTISFPVAYFTGYHPEVTYLKSTPNTVINEPFPYHDLNILKLYAQGKSVEEAVTIIRSEDFYDTEFVHHNFHKTLGRLYEREKNLDVQLSSFIKENFHLLKLFHTFNHPTQWTINFMIESILSILVFPASWKTYRELVNTDVLSRSSFPIYPSLAKKMGLEFDLANEYRIDKISYAPKNVIERFFDFYKKNSDCVASYLKYTSMRT